MLSSVPNEEIPKILHKLNGRLTDFWISGQPHYVHYNEKIIRVIPEERLNPSLSQPSSLSLIRAISLRSVDLQESPKHMADIALSCVRHQIPWFAILVAAGAASSVVFSQN